MYPSKTPWLFVLQLLCVTVGVIATLLLTGNALALFAFMLFWNPPQLLPENMGDGDEEEESTAIGFVQDS